jgi:catechol 2,3-dioxygenase-like lactoylglutathione lyase family enzyme
MLTNPENSLQPADICQSPPAAADEGDNPSQLLGAFIHYLRARPTRVDSDSTRFDDGRRHRTPGDLLQNARRTLKRRKPRGDRTAAHATFPDKEPIGLTSTKADRQAPESGISADVVASVVRVSDLDRSLKFYCDVFSCRVAVREADMALLLTPKGFEIYLHQKDEFHSRTAGALGVHHLMWATDSQSDMQRITEVAGEADVERTPFGRYRLVELLGRGGMGEVWRAIDTATDRVVALKVLLVNFVDDEVFQKRFRRATRTRLNPDSASWTANCSPMPAVAPVTNAYGPYFDCGSLTFSLPSVVLDAGWQRPPPLW